MWDLTFSSSVSSSSPRISCEILMGRQVRSGTAQQVWALLIDVWRSEGAAAAATGRRCHRPHHGPQHWWVSGPKMRGGVKKNSDGEAQQLWLKKAPSGRLLLGNAGEEWLKYNVMLSGGEKLGHKYVSSYRVISSTVLVWSSLLCAALAGDTSVT